MDDLKAMQKDTKKLFLTLGACSQLFFYLLNREFGYPLETEERAADPLCGGIMMQGQQCGMLVGALATTIWMNSLAWCRKNPGKSAPIFFNPNAKKTIKAFYGATDSEILCHKISGQCFKTLDDHTEFIIKGGCDKLINVLAHDSH